MNSDPVTITIQKDTRVGGYSYIIAIHPEKGVLNFAGSYTNPERLKVTVRKYYPNASFFIKL